MESQKIDIKNNMEIHRDENYIVVSLNPKMHSLDVIYSAAYVFLDRAYIIIGGNPEKEIIVEMKPKDQKIDLEDLGYEFNNEILNYSVYKTQVKQNEGIRNAIIQRALLTNDVYNEGSDESYIDDPEGIAVPWEEKYGRKESSREPEAPETEEDIEVPWEELEKDSDEVAGNKQKRKDNKDKV
jgi:His-Xaa-Ser system protein HxsD